MKCHLPTSVLAACLLAGAAFAAPPADQNFDALTPQESALNGSLTFSGVTYSTDAVDDALRVDTIANVTGSLPSLGSGNGLSSVWYGTNTGTYLQFASVNAADDFRIASFNAEVWGHNSQNSEVYTLTGYDGATEVASATVNFRVTGIYGTGVHAISYTRLTTALETTSSGDGANAGTLTFTGSGWGKVDRVRITVADTEPNIILGVSIDLLDFEAPTGSASVPTVTTPTKASITHNSATLGGNVTADGGAALTERGVVYAMTSINSNPEIGGIAVTKVVASGTTTGVFTAAASGLVFSTGYTYKAYATNSAGTSYSSADSFTTAPAPVAVVFLNRADATPSNAATVNWTLNLASAVTGMTAANFELTGAAATGASVGTPTTANAGLTWTIPVTTGGTDGALTLRLANATGLSAALTGLPYSGQSYTMDKTAPQVQSVVRQLPTGQTTSATSLTFRVTYTEAVTGVDTGRFALQTVSGGTVTGTVTGVTPVSASVYDVAVSLTGGDGEFRLRVLD